LQLKYKFKFLEQKQGKSQVSEISDVGFFLRKSLTKAVVSHHGSPASALAAGEEIDDDACAQRADYNAAFCNSYGGDSGVRAD
jgi:hypothetical protein